MAGDSNRRLAGIEAHGGLRLMHRRTHSYEAEGGEHCFHYVFTSQRGVDWTSPDVLRIGLSCSGVTSRALLFLDVR